MPSTRTKSSSRRAISGDHDSNRAIRSVRTVAAFLEEARSRIVRVAPSALEAEIRMGAMVIDIRPIDQRERDGVLPGALIIDRNVVEWRVAPSSKARTVTIRDGQRVIIVCNQGYQSSLVAAVLVELGVPGATDLVGGYQAYLAHQRRSSARN